MFGAYTGCVQLSILDNGVCICKTLGQTQRNINVYSCGKSDLRPTNETKKNPYTIYF